MTLTQTVTGLFDTYDLGKAAVRDLEAQGVAHQDISIVANDAHGQHRGDRAAEDAGKGAGLGAAMGGVGGLLAGIGFLAIPGLGPVVAAGWLASTAVGALVGGAVGAAAGGIVGALTKEGVSEDDAHVYAEGVRRGGTLVTAKVQDAIAPMAATILHSPASVDLASRRDIYRAEGWTRFDATAPAYTAAQIDAERTRYDRV